jgi:hypothetical protein
MNTLRNLKLHVREMAKLHPEKRDDIYDFYQLACDEVEEGGSESHECSLAIESIRQLIEDAEETD